MLTVQALITFGITPSNAALFIDPLNEACTRFEINTPKRLAGFLAQCRVESLAFTHLEESLYYSTPERVCAVFPNRVPILQAALPLIMRPQALANRVYAGRYGNRDEASGDGWKYRGRGLKMITFADNYKDAGIALGRPYLDQPDLVSKPEDAAMTGAWFWSTIKGNTLADNSQWDLITRAVNGPAMLQAANRRQYSEQGVTLFV